MTPDPWICERCGQHFVVPSLATTPNRNHQPGCPLRTQEQR